MQEPIRPTNPSATPAKAHSGAAAADTQRFRHHAKAINRSTIQDMDKPLKGKTVLVTGAAQRIGRAIALALAERGADVAITYLASQPEAVETVRALAAHEVDASAIRCDLRDPESIEETVASVMDEFGQIDLLVNNAGMFESVALENITVEQWDGMFATNTRAPFLMAKAAHPHLRAAKGRI